MDVQRETTELLEACFDDAEAMRLFLRRRYGADLERALPGASAVGATVFDAAADALRRRGLVDAELLAQLHAHSRGARLGLEPRIEALAQALGVGPLPRLAPSVLGGRSEFPLAIAGTVLTVLLVAVVVSRTPAAPRGLLAFLGTWASTGVLAWGMGYAAPEQARRVSVGLDELAAWLQAATVDRILDLADTLLSRVYGPVILGPLALRRIGTLSLLVPGVLLAAPSLVGLGARPPLLVILLVAIVNLAADLLSHAHTHQLLREVRPRATAARLAGLLVVVGTLVAVLALLPAGVVGWWLGKDAGVRGFLTSTPRELLFWTGATAALPSLVLCCVAAVALLSRAGDGVLLRTPGRLLESVAQDRTGALSAVYFVSTVVVMGAVIASG